MITTSSVFSGIPLHTAAMVDPLPSTANPTKAMWQGGPGPARERRLSRAPLAHLDPNCPRFSGRPPPPVPPLPSVPALCPTPGVRHYTLTRIDSVLLHLRHNRHFISFTVHERFPPDDAPELLRQMELANKHAAEGQPRRFEVVNPGLVNQLIARRNQLVQQISGIDQLIDRLDGLRQQLQQGIQNRQEQGAEVWALQIELASVQRLLNRNLVRRVSLSDRLLGVENQEAPIPTGHGWVA